MQNILVTGGAGYVGSVLVPKLLDAGHKVRILDSMLFGSYGLAPVQEDCEIVTGDIEDSGLVKRCVEGMDSVIHLAGVANDPCGDLDPGLTKRVNYNATRDLISASKQAGAGRFIYASSSSVYGIKEEPNVTEDLSLDPLTIYSESKVWTEQFLNGIVSDDFVGVSIRPATVCGFSPRMRLDLTVNILTSAAINNGKITVFGGSQKRPNLHIEDMTDYYVQLLEIPGELINGQAFNAGYENHTVMEIAEMTRGVVGDHVSIETTPTDDIRSYHISSQKIKDTLGLVPQWTIIDAVNDVKHAFETGLIPNHEDAVYKNIETMRAILS